MPLTTSSSWPAAKPGGPSLGCLRNKGSDLDAISWLPCKNAPVMSATQRNQSRWAAAICRITRVPYASRWAHPFVVPRGLDLGRRGIRSWPWLSKVARGSLRSCPGNTLVCPETAPWGTLPQQPGLPRGRTGLLHRTSSTSPIL